MRKSFESAPNGVIHVFALAILLAVVWYNLFALGNGIYDDAFHHGEYVASLPSVLAGNMDFFTIHGVMDWLPAWLSQHAVGAEKHFLLTKIIYTSLSALACLLLYVVMAVLIDKDNKYRAFLLLTSAVLGVSLVGARDVFLVTALACFVLCEKSVLPVSRYMLELVLGVLLALTLFWSFDRGAGILALGGAGFVLIIAQRRYLLAFATFVASLLTIAWLDASFLLAYIKNFAFLLATSAQWRYEFTSGPKFWTAIAVIPNGWAIYYLAKQLRFSFNKNWQETAHLLLLIALGLLMLKVGTNRADPPHIAMALWIPALAFAYLHGRTAVRLPLFATATILAAIIGFAIKGDYDWFLLGTLIPIISLLESKFPEFVSKITSQKFVIVVIAVPVLAFHLVKIIAKYHDHQYQWLSEISAPPSNSSLTTESIQWVSAEIIKANSHCVFDFANNGVINGVTGLPACTKYIYPVYATQQYEADMLQQLQQQRPPVVVFSTTYWSFTIDGRSMHERLPKVTDYLVKTYPYEVCKLDYCLRYLSSPTK